VLEQTLSYYSLQPDTAGGRRVWLQQLRNWRERNGERKPTAFTGLPLHPGGAVPGSAECFGCGKVGHCQFHGLCLIVEINACESTFWMICGCILCFNPPPPQSHHVHDAEEFKWLGDLTLPPPYGYSPSSCIISFTIMIWGSNQNFCKCK
jgi:hypothetical protein